MKKTLLSLGLLACIACNSELAGTSTEGTVALSADCPFVVTRHDPSSWLLVEPEVHLDFWGPYWKTMSGTTDQYAYWSDWVELLDDNGTVLQRLAEYGIHGGTADVHAYDVDPSVNVLDGGVDGATEAGVPEIDDAEIPNELAVELVLGLLPYPNDNTLYVVMLPPGVTTHKMVNGHANGYHNWATYDGQRFAYAVILYQSNQNANVVVSHEIYEAATDPDVRTGYFDPSGIEVADVCEAHGSESTLVIDGVTVQKVWSQNLCTCE